MNVVSSTPAALMSKVEMTELIMAAKFIQKKSWKEISEAAGMSEVFVVSAIHDHAARLTSVRMAAEALADIPAAAAAQ